MRVGEEGRGKGAEQRGKETEKERKWEEEQVSDGRGAWPVGKGEGEETHWGSEYRGCLRVKRGNKSVSALRASSQKEEGGRDERRSAREVNERSALVLDR